MLIGVLFFIAALLVGLIFCVAALGVQLDKWQREQSPAPATQTLSQNTVVRADQDFTTIQPQTLAAATCTHQWDVVTDQRLDVEHEQKHVLVMTCRHCGNTDKTVTTTSK